MNSAKAAYKFSKLEIYANWCIGIILSLQMILAIIAATIGTHLNTKSTTSVSWVEDTPPRTNKWGLTFQLIGTWILLQTNFVPISLIVQMELVKFWQAMFMTYEADMYDVRQGLEEDETGEE